MGRNLDQIRHDLDQIRCNVAKIRCDLDQIRLGSSSFTTSASRDLDQILPDLHQNRHDLDQIRHDLDQLRSRKFLHRHLLSWFSPHFDPIQRDLDQTQLDLDQIQNSLHVRVFTFATGKSFGAEESILKQMKNNIPAQVLITGLEVCDIIMVFCPITDRVGSNVDAVLRTEEVSLTDKPIILILLHHTRQSDYSTGRKSLAKSLTPNFRLVAHVLFHETQPQGLLHCDINNEAVRKIQNELYKHSK